MLNLARGTTQDNTGQQVCSTLTGFSLTGCSKAADLLLRGWVAACLSVCLGVHVCVHVCVCRFLWVLVALRAVGATIPPVMK